MHFPLILMAAVVLIGFTLADTNAMAQPRVEPAFYVAPNGNDANTGTQQAPFATLERARQEVRKLKATALLRGPILVAVRGGTYFLQKPLVFTPEDSGLPGMPVIYAAHNNEKPIFSGGQRLTGWKNEGGRWTTTLPDAAAGKWSFARLSVNGQSRHRPRLPKKGFYYVRGELEPTEANKGKGFDRFEFKPGDIKANWAHLNDVELLGIHTWAMSRLRIAAVDEAESVVNFTGRTPNTQSYTKFPRAGRYLLENVKEALSEPGEFYLDRQSGVLTYLPMPGENPATAEVIAPRLSRLIEFAGDVTNKTWVQNIQLRGLAFAHTNWETPKEGYSFVQAEAPLGAAISATGGRNLVVENCRISQTGEWAIALNTGCKNNRVDNCEMLDLGAGGIKIGEMRAFDDDDAVASHNIVQENLFAHGGRLHPAAVGVWIGHSPHNKVLHNEIFDFYYTGISPGWSWGYNRSLSHHNEIAYNHIHQIGQGVLSDMGGIYTLGAGEGNHLHHNLIHDIESYSYGGWGIYFDEGTAKILAENNVVYRTKSAGFHQHYGRENTVRNNVFAFGREAQLMRTRPEPEHFTLDIQRNIVLYNDAPLLGSNWEGTNFKLDNNLYWRTDGKPVVFYKGMTLEQWQAKGQDKNSLIADPLFVNPDKGDFTLKANSPAFKLNFSPIDISTAGRTKAPKYLGTMPRAFPEYAPPPVMPIEQNFEKVALGAKVTDGQTYEDSEQATARVSDEAAFVGTRSLKFTDAAGGKFPYNPHVYWNPNFENGLARASFALRPEAGAIINHEWRDKANPYHVGPSLWIEGDGTLKVNQQTVAKLPHGAWTKFEISCALGEGANGEWNLTLTLPNETSRTMNFTCNKEFRSLNWFGFVSNATDKAVFYLDDVKVQPGL